MIVHTLEAALGSEVKNSTALSSRDRRRDTYGGVRITTLSLAEPIERFRLRANGTGELLVLCLSTFAALDRALVDIIAEEEMVPQIQELFVGISGHRLDSLAYRATDPERDQLGSNSSDRRVHETYLSGTGCCFNLNVPSVYRLSRTHHDSL